MKEELEKMGRGLNWQQGMENNTKEEIGKGMKKRSECVKIQRAYYL